LILFKKKPRRLWLSENRAQKRIRNSNHLKINRIIIKKVHLYKVIKWLCSSSLIMPTSYKHPITLMFNCWSNGFQLYTFDKTDEMYGKVLTKARKNSYRKFNNMKCKTFHSVLLHFLLMMKKFCKSFHCAKKAQEIKGHLNLIEWDYRVNYK